MIGHCLPRGSWLESVRVEQPGAVAILGTGPSEDAVYEFVRHLKNVPVLQNVSLESQRPTRLQNGSGIMFDIKSNFVGRNDHPERTARNDRTAIAASP
jgi:Tfp pilus assembly protein PilN